MSPRSTVRTIVALVIVAFPLAGALAQMMTNPYGPSISLENAKKRLCPRSLRL